MSDSMQIESLWRFNAKFDPVWQPRFVVWDSAEQSLGAALAIARAESFWELPIIGRFLVPAAPEEAAAVTSGDGAATPVTTS
jgi:lysyl-tRNA synthetase class 2